jgi:hypothetical protein
VSERTTRQPIEQTGKREADDAARAVALEFVRSLARAAARDLFAKQAGAVDDAKA